MLHAPLSAVRTPFFRKRPDTHFCVTGQRWLDRQTPELLERYRADPRVEILTQANRGLSGARNRALEHIRGKYILFVDSDDTLRKGAVEALLSKAMETNADIVQGGFINITGHGLVFGRTGYREGFVDETGQTPYGMAWGKVIRSSLFAHLKFPEGYWFEDTIFAFCIAPFQPTHYLIPEYVCNYTRNPLGITLRSRKKAKAVDTVWIMRYLMAELAQKKRYTLRRCSSFCYSTSRWRGIGSPVWTKPSSRRHFW